MVLLESIHMFPYPTTISDTECMDENKNYINLGYNRTDRGGICRNSIQGARHLLVDLENEEEHLLSNSPLNVSCAPSTHPKFDSSSSISSRKSRIDRRSFDSTQTNFKVSLISLNFVT